MSFSSALSTLGLFGAEPLVSAGAICSYVVEYVLTVPSAHLFLQWMKVGSLLQGVLLHPMVQMGLVV